MTEQEIEQARAEVDQLGIEQLRCGVLLQLLHIESLKKERDEWLARHAECCRLMGECMQDRADMATERDALAAAAKRALDSAVDVYATCDRYGDGDQKAMESLSKAIEALRAAGVK
jgi:D-serine deaminase-like pyridoxal phosphate-dependent protein